MSNKFDDQMIKEFDPARASAKQVRGWLYAIIEVELAKDDREIDDELIQECSDCDAYLTGDRDPIADEEYQKALALIQKRVSETGSGHSGKVLIAPKKKKRIALRVLAVAAAVLAVLLSLTVLAAARRQMSVPDFIRANLKGLRNAGDTVEGDGVTLIKAETTAEYRSLEEAIQALNPDILYPTFLPDGVKIERVTQIDTGDPEEYSVTFISNNFEKFGMIVHHGVIADTEHWERGTIYEINGVQYRVAEATHGWQASGLLNEFEYSIKCADFDDLIKVLESMKGIEK